VLLDEPLSALDAKLRQELRVELKQVLASVRATTIVVAHDQGEAMSLAERIIVMNHGAIVQQGTPDEIYPRPNSRFVAEFMGRSNWFAGRITGQSGAGGLTFATASGITLRIPAPAQPHPTEVDVCIRPERIDLAWGSEAAAGAAVGPGVNQIAGRVAGAALLGADRQFVIELAGGDRIVASLPNRARSVPTEGEPVSIRFSAEDCIVVPTGM
jgi:putative spermidine/putrescine transport system ATP-binding protein/putrescine transport system ATP-binding protein